MKLTRRDGTRYGYFVDRGAETGWLPFLNANGGALFDKEGKRSAVNSAELREALEYLANLGSRHQVTPHHPGAGAGKRGEPLPQRPPRHVAPGKLADQGPQPQGQGLHLGPGPGAGGAPQTQKNGGTNQMASVAMARTTRKKDAVWEWQKFIGSKAGQDTIARAEYFPARTDSAEQIYYKPELGPANRPLLRDVLKVVQALPCLDVAGNTAGWGPIVNPLIAQMFDGHWGSATACSRCTTSSTPPSTAASSRERARRRALVPAPPLAAPPAGPGGGQSGSRGRTRAGAPGA